MSILPPTVISIFLRAFATLVFSSRGQTEEREVHTSVWALGMEYEKKQDAGSL